MTKNEPLLVAVDAEGGLINRLKPSMGFADIDSAQDLGKEDGLVAVNEYWALAKQLRDLGFNVNFAPVIDININPKNPVIGGLERSYSSNPQTVADYAKGIRGRAPRFWNFDIFKAFSRPRKLGFRQPLGSARHHPNHMKMKSLIPTKN